MHVIDSASTSCGEDPRNRFRPTGKQYCREMSPLVYLIAFRVTSRADGLIETLLMYISNTCKTIHYLTSILGKFAFASDCWFTIADNEKKVASG